MKKILCLIMLLVSILTLASCTDDNSQNGGQNQGDDTPSKYPTSVDAYLEEGIDYIDHSNTYENKKFTYNESMWYINELKDVPLPDPHVYVENDTYYIVGTTDRDNSVIDCYVTTDFVHYQRHTIYDSNIYNYSNIDNKSGLSKEEDIWYRDVEYAVIDGKNTKLGPSLYAPELYKFGGKYYLYYSAYDENTSSNISGIRRNSVLVADSVLGPYEHVKQGNIDGYKQPVFTEEGKTKTSVLDSTIFVDTDGQMYMYYSVAEYRASVDESQHIVGVKMISPIEADWSTYTEIVRPGFQKSGELLLNQFNTLAWERYRDYGSIAEAPYMIKSNGKYYMTYSVNGCWNKYYNVCYAVGNSPLGIFEKPFDYKSKAPWTNLLLGYPGDNIESSKVFKQWNGFASGTAHHCFFKIGDQWMIGYHAHANRNHNDEDKWIGRYFAFEPLHFDDKGVPYVNGPSYSLQPLPEAISGYKNIALDATVYVENVENVDAINDNYIVDCYNLPQEKGKEVVIGSGLAFIELEFDDEYEIGGIAIYNSAYYDNYISEISYIDFGDGNAIEYVQFCSDKYVNYSNDFIFPNSAFTVQFDSEIHASSVVLCFELEDLGQINEIVVLGK